MRRKKFFDPADDALQRVFLKKVIRVVHFMGDCVERDHLPLAQHSGRKHEIMHAPEKERRRGRERWP